MLFLIALCFPLTSQIVHAETVETATEQELNENIQSLLESLDVEELQNYLDTLSTFGGISVKDTLKKVIDGNFSLDYASLGEAVLSLVWEEMSLLLPSFAIILAISLLCGVLNSAKSSFLHSTMSDMIGFVSYLSVGAVILSCLIVVLNAGYEAIHSMQTQMQLVYPILLSLMSASGGTVSAAIYRPAVAFMSGAVLELFLSVVLPTSTVILALSWIGGLSGEVRTEKLADFFKSINKWLIGLTLGLFTLFLSVQGISSAQYDGISLRTVKYVISGSVPIVGGFLSGSVDLIMAGSALIKNALGSFSIFVLVGTILRPLLVFVAFQLFLRIAAAATEPIGGKIPAMLSKIAGALNSFIAALLCIAFLYFLSVLLLVCSSGVIF